MIMTMIVDIIAQQDKSMALGDGHVMLRQEFRVCCGVAFAGDVLEGSVRLLQQLCKKSVNNVSMTSSRPVLLLVYHLRQVLPAQDAVADHDVVRHQVPLRLRVGVADHQQEAAHGQSNAAHHRPG
jgi:hypothetical protein